MEFASFLKVLWKNKNLLIIIPLVTIIVSYFLVKNLPDKYLSYAHIATGIVDESRHLLDNDNNQVQRQQITQNFSNLIEMMKLSKLYNQVSYRLILHDLTQPTPFKPYSKLFMTMNDAAKKHAIVVFTDKLKRMEPLDTYDKDQRGLNNLLNSMWYDERSLRGILWAERDGDSDFITVTSESSNPQMSAFVVNALCEEFISYYTHTVRQNETDAVTFLAGLLNEKREALNRKTAQLQQYKIEHGVLNIDEQSRGIFSQIMTYNDRRLSAEKDVASYEGTIKNINGKFDPKDRQYIEASLNKYNTSVTATQDELHALTNKYVRSNFDPAVKAQIDSVTKTLSQQIALTSDKYLTNPLATKENLVTQKINLEISRDIAKYSIKEIDKALAGLNAKFQQLVPFDATVKTYNFELDIASKEYLDVLNKYNETNLQSTFSVKLQQVEQATPQGAEPSKKMLLIILSGIIAFAFCVVILFIRFFLDDSIKSPADLVRQTNLPLLGYLNTVSGGSLDLRKLWDVEHREKMKHFKELIRSIRFEIDQELKGDKVLAITSLVPDEGKTVLAISLAYSYAMINKKVLLIDGNFSHPTITNTAQPRLFVEDYFKNNPDNYEAFSGATTVLGNHGDDVTPLEVSDEIFIRNRFAELKTKYDIIIIETPALSSLNKSKEWMLFANKVVAVYGARKSVKSSQKENLNFLRSLDNKFAGWILNKAAIPED
ncbi:lipopolysaccharide biosynthesis protein [Mucilaginibacter terrenus]|uniref:Lipopolysaccharide biosynthesis protein n=1 Tax=Mucilaginibacter terrenus TaxID=2482727 RepID=A0A3E2NU58_9SPHI|nr:Wzz/FepE/Etk N-terminal domain-containing protein [Mucilaginibacter terrenus]RFZ84546.1 lipopolysaccharide biosynthesis protein [Mucilaginibacter terrenus]